MQLLRPLWLIPFIATGLGLLAPGPAARAQTTPAPAAAPAEAPAPRGRLVDPAWLQQHRGQVLLLDASATPQHRAGHIAGAVNADRYSHGAQEATPAQMEARLRGWGVSPGQRIVIYDRGGDFMAARLFYDLVHHGVPDDSVYLLDGGLARWKAEGGAVAAHGPQAVTPAPPPGTWRVTTVREADRVRLPEFLVASGNPGQQVLMDAMGPAYHYGASRLFDRAGHVPNAVSLPSDDFFNADKTFKSAAEVQRLLRYLGVRPDQMVHSHCGGGGAAAVNWFALKYIAGHARVRLYQESQHEWLRDERGLPFWTYSAPQRLRSIAWLAGWNAPMLRLFGMARLSLLDVRDPAAYAQGHLPFAVNVPAARIQQQAAHPAQLAATLAAAGVQPGHDVVLMAEGGLTRDLALAQAALEQLGLPSVSLLLASPDDWALAGRELTREATAIRPARNLQDMAVPPGPLQPLLQLQARPLWVAEGAAGTGEFATVRVDLGAQTTARSGPEPVVHLPAAQLLDPNGSPQPAAKLWTLLDKAGVPRHARLLLQADEPGDAAIGLVVFRLMGWPDLRLRAP